MIALESLSDTLTWLWQAATDPIVRAPWRFWAGGDSAHWWVQHIFADRYRVAYFLPLLPILMLLKGRALKVGIVATCLVFLGWNLGLIYPLLWLLLCVVFYRITEQFTVEIKRTDVLKIGPPLAATAAVLLACGLFDLFKYIPLPAELNAWLYEHMPYLFGLGTRGIAWQPNWLEIAPPPPLFATVFLDPHMIGTAYFAVRMLHYFSELKKETIPRERRSLLNFVSYLCYAPTLMQGPIERYQAYHDEIESCHQRRSWRNVPPALYRFGLALVKMLCVHWYLKEFLFYYGLHGQGPGPSYYGTPEAVDSYYVLYTGVFWQIFSLYLMFSGYCDIAAGISRLLGYRLVENFNMPWISTSLRDYWRRWHISLSFLLRDYVYIAMGGNRRHIWLNLAVTFVLCGIWHKIIPGLFAWGVVMGTLVYANQRWVQWVKRVDERRAGWMYRLRRAASRVRPLPTIFAWFVTQNVFVLSLLVFFGNEGAIRVGWELLRRPLNAVLSWAGSEALLPSVNALWSAWLG